MAWLILIGVLVVGAGLWSLIAPRSQWMLLQSWKYRDPDANEPSDIVYGLTRVGGAAAIIVYVIAVIGLWNSLGS